MADTKRCPYESHTAHSQAIIRNEKDIQVMSEKVDKLEEDLNKKFDTVKNIVISGLAGTIIQIIIILIVVLKWKGIAP